MLHPELLHSVRLKLKDIKGAWENIPWKGISLGLVGVGLLSALGGLGYLGYSLATEPVPSTDENEATPQASSSPKYYLRVPSLPEVSLPDSPPSLMNKKFTISWKDPRDSAIKPLMTYFTNEESVHPVNNLPIRSWSSAGLSHRTFFLFQMMSSDKPPEGPIEEVRMECLASAQCALSVEELKDEDAPKTTDPIKGTGDETVEGVVTVLFQNKPEVRVVALSTMGSGFVTPANSWRINQSWIVKDSNLTPVGKETGRGTWAEDYTLSHSGVVGMIFEKKKVWVTTPKSIRAARVAQTYQ